VDAFLGLGSNVGERLATLQRPVDLLAEEPSISIRRSSRVWETDPVGGPEQPDFLNAVVEVDTDLDPLDLLAAIDHVEARLGRFRNIHWGPRTIDIDILLIDGLVLTGERLTVPHPRMHERAFVIAPLLELIPDPVLPTGIRLLDVRLTDQPVRPHAPPLKIPS
jgi:2-amino-4-hydroxy-6-hydroxymethyldihydropteridine diphosphokinase